MSDDLSKVEFGEPIECRGQKPDGFPTGRVPVQWSYNGRPYLDVVADHCKNFGLLDQPVLIRLPADHPYYRQAYKPTPAEHASGAYDPDCAACREYAEPVMENPISDPIAKRMEALVRALAESRYGISLADEARAIVALMPEPVDGDEQYARDLIRDHGWSDMGNIGIEAVTIMIAKAHREGRALERDSREG